jgi:hypothetical protein
LSDTDSGTSSEYSDWVADSGTNLEPPKRTQHRRRRVKRPTTPPSSPSPPSSPHEGPKTVPPRKVQKVNVKSENNFFSYLYILCYVYY